MIINYEEFIIEKKQPTPEDFGITKYEWVDGVLDCFQDVDLSLRKLKKLPFSFGKIDGCFLCSENDLTNLEGFPHTVNGYFSCRGNKLTNLVGCPQIVKRFFYCHNNRLTSLEGCPQIINDDFSCFDNKLTNLEHCPKIVNGDFLCHKNNFRGLVNYPLCDIRGSISNCDCPFGEMLQLFKQNRDKFIPLLDNKIAFHQMAMRLKPIFYAFYNSKIIPRPTKKTILLDI